MKKTYIFIISMLFVFGVKGQHWTGLLQTENPTFFEIQDAFNQYWEPYNVVNGKYIENGAEKKAYGWKQFKRWEWFWEPRVDENGLFPASDVNLTEWQNYLDAHPEALNNTSGLSSGNWTEWGPAFISALPNNPIGIGRLNCIAFHPNNANIFWVGSPAGGLWKTIDGGSSWSTTTDNLPVMGVSDIAIDHTNTNIIYIATGDGDNGSITGDTKSKGVYKSIDGGNTFNPTDLNWQVHQEKTIRRLLIDPVNPQVLIAATSDGIWRTGNGGATFTQVASGYFMDIEFKPSNSSYVYGTTYENTINPNTKIFRSINNGVTWSQVAIFPAGEVIRSDIAVSPAQPDLLDIVTVNTSRGLHGLYYSTNSGGTFYNNGLASYTNCANPNSFSASSNFLGSRYDATSCKGQGNYDLAFATNPNDPNEMWLGGINTWKSTDGGTSWALMTMANTSSSPSSWCYNPNNILIQHADKHFFAFHPITNDIYECNDGGLFVSSDGGVSWTNKSNGLGIGQIYRIGAASSISNHVITGLQDNGTKELFNNFWYQDPPGGDGMECIINPTNGNIQYAAVQLGAIYKTTDAWQNSTLIVDNNLQTTGINQESAWVTPYLMHPNNTNTLIVGKKQVYQTTNGGTNWSAISGTFPSFIKSMAYAPSNPQVIYVATDYDFYTNNGVNNWQSPTGSNNSDKITYIAVDPNNAQRVFITKSGYSLDNKVWESTDGGTTWTNISGTSLPNVPANCITYQDGSNDGLYVGTDLGVYYKDATMNNWIPLNNGLPNVIVNELEISYVNNKLWAGTYGRGLWECDIVVSGCTDPLACNYNPQANINDNSCSYMSVNTSSTNVTCYGGTNGTASVIVSSGAAPYTYQWSTGASVASLSNLSSGNYTCTVTDATGCSITSSVVISQPSAINLVMTSTPECYGSNDGTASVTTVSNAVPPYSYLWSTGSTNSSISGLYASTYGCTVTDANGCTTNSSVVVSQLQAISLNISSTPLSTSCSNDATATISASGGAPPFTYQWNDANAQTSVTAINLSSGTYICMVTDANGCSITGSVVIGQSQGLSLSMSSSPVTCFGGANGTANAGISGGVGPYTWLWSNGQTSSPATNLSAGSYSCTVTDSNGCSISGNINVTEPSLLVVTTSSTNVSCFGGANGTANAAVSGGVGPYTWLWSNGQTSSPATNLSAGSYSCTVTDFNGCSISGNINVTEPSTALVVTTSSIDVSCFGGANGTANAAVSGGVGPYTWLWSNGQTSSPATNLSAGSYSCTVTDLNGCQSSISVFLSQPTQLFFSASYSYFNGFGVSCYGATDGKIEIFNPSGGTPNYTFSINGGVTYSSSMIYNGLGSGAYVVMSKDANDCVSSSTPINLTSPPVLSGVIVQPNIDLEVNANGGVPTYNYLWNTNQTTQTITPQSNGIYWCIITDANNCVTNKIYRTVNNIPSAIAELEISNLSIYPNPNDGYFTIEFSSLITQNLNVKITNAIGEIVFIDNKQNYMGEYKKQINLKDYANGIYFLEIETHKGTTNHKIILY